MEKFYVYISRKILYTLVFYIIYNLFVYETSSVLNQVHVVELHVKFDIPWQKSVWQSVYIDLIYGV